MAIAEQFHRDLLTPNEARLFRNTINVYNDRKFAQMYFEKWRNDLPTGHLAAFSQLVGLRGKVLDAGCGPGHHTHHLQNLGHEAIGIDLSHEELKLARANFVGPDFLLSNMLETPFASCAFGGIWACASAMHLPQALFEPLLAEFCRILTSGGVVALTMTVESRAHVDAFGRFFEIYQFAYLVETITKFGLQLEGKDERLRHKTTEQEGHAAGWVTLTARKN